ncbi:MAG: hypothetical protein QM723_15215 [Myxococcaceae bacterium]
MIALAFLVPLTASAACTGVDVTFDGARWTEAQQAKVVEELQPEIEKARLCKGEHRATVLLEWPGDDELGLSVRFMRGGVEHELKRHLDPTHIPEDALALAVAAVAGDLLNEVVPQPAAAAAAPHELALGARGSASAGSGFYGGGGDLVGRFTLGSIGLQLTFGAAAGNANAGAAGSVDSTRLDLGASGLLRMVGGQAWAISAEVGFHFSEYWLTPHPKPGYTARDASVFSVAGRAGLDFTFHVGPALLMFSGGAELPFPGVDVTDGSRKLATPIDWAGYLTVGVGYSW